MTDLTHLTLKAARDGLKARSFSARELAKAHVGAMERHRALNAFITESTGRPPQGQHRNCRRGPSDRF
jgi:aspartyl-tRNA(Asn)/glutamyl-tRNA(Gln) amidotransferase subunit A